MNRISYAIVFILLCSGALTAQDKGQPIIKSEVLDAHIMFEKQVWRRMDLNERQNKPMFSKNAELPRLLIDAVREGLIKPYRSDTCINLLTDDEFEEAVSVERQSNDAFGGGFDSFGGGGGFDSGGFGGGFGDTQTSTTEPAPEANTKEYDPIPGDVFDIAYLREDVIFDRNRSRMLWYIRSITIVLPFDAGPYNPAGFEKPVAHFRYQDVVDLFRGPYAEKAIWFNNQNQAQHRNLADAFELRLFHAPILEVSNAQSLDVKQLAEGYESVVLSQQYEDELMEYESELWEY
ncbi:MAG: hypothetical protein ACFHWX_21285 [Bacteroidota bacterium]